MATVAGEEPAHAQVHATGVQLLRGRKEACDCVCKINHLFAFLFALFLSCAQNPRALSTSVVRFSLLKRTSGRSFKLFF
jgi:hypothetical protein